MNTINTPNNNLISKIYESVMAPDGFQGFISTLAEVFNLKSVTMIIRHSKSEDVKGLWITGIPNEWMSSYVLDYAKEDILAHHILVSPIAHFYASNLDVPHPEKIIESRFFKEWVIPQGVACAAGAVIFNEDDWLTQIIVQRTPHHPAFTRNDLDQLNELVPHLQRAIQMRQRFTEIQIGQNFLVGGLDVLAMPTFLFDEHGMVAHFNQSATHFLNTHSIAWLHNKNFRTTNNDTNHRLNLEIFHAIDASRGRDAELNSAILLPRPGSMPLMLMVSPLYLSGISASHGGALLFAFDPLTTPNITEDVVCKLFSLSKGEAKLSIALCEGKTLDEIADDHGTSIHTVKSQLKSTFLKTGTKRQSELVSLLLASPAYFLAAKPYI